jgi:hypothetical protein
MAIPLCVRRCKRDPRSPLDDIDASVLRRAATDGQRPFPGCPGRLARREGVANFVDDFGERAAAHPFAGLQKPCLRARRERRGHLDDALAHFRPLLAGQPPGRAGSRGGRGSRAGRLRFGLASVPGEKRSAEERDDRTIWTAFASMTPSSPAAPPLLPIARQPFYRLAPTRSPNQARGSTTARGSCRLYRDPPAPRRRGNLRGLHVDEFLSFVAEDFELA